MTSGATDGGAIAGGTSKGIGSAWSRTPLTPDVAFTYTLNGGTLTTGIVEYTGTTPIRSDLNGDGVLTVADWSLFVPQHGKAFTGELGVAAYLKGDLDADLDNDYADFLLFKGDYTAANGASAFAVLTAVPEPTSVLIVGVASLALVALRRRAVRD